MNGPARAVALVAAAAVGLAGAVVAGSLTAARPAEAVSFSNGWGGVFGPDQLWSKSLGTSYYEVDDTAPDYAGSISITSSTLLQKFVSTGTANGAAGGAVDAAIGAGPVFKGSGDHAIHMVGSMASGLTYVYRSVVDGGVRKVNGLSYGNITTASNVEVTNGATTSACRPTGDRLSADVNQRTGYLYQVAGPSDPKLDATATSWSLNAAVYRLNAPTASAKFTCLAGVTSVTAAGGKSLNDQWVAQVGKAAPNVSSWKLSTDIATDASGNIYFLAVANVSRAALLRLDVPYGANGLPISAGWTLRLVKGFELGVDDVNLTGVAFADGAVYSTTSGGMFRRWNVLGGLVEPLNSIPNGAGEDLAAAQPVPVIEGTVYNDKNGDGAIQSSEPGVAGITVEIFRNTALGGANPVWTKLGSVLTDSEGRYVAVPNATTGQFLVRVRKPIIEKTAAVQTYATSQANTFNDGATTWTNTARPYCSGGQGKDYQLTEPSGTVGVVCNGARWDGVDPTNLNANPLATTGGAETITRVDLNSPAAPVEADFGLTINGSWGDAPAGYVTTLTEEGPYANPRRAGTNYLWMGAQAGRYNPQQDNTNPNANAHGADDGVWYARTDSAGNATGEWQMLQNQMMAKGKTYIFRALASGSAEARGAATLKAWITSLSSSGAIASSFDTPLLGGGGACSATPEADGYVYCKYTAPANVPSDGVAKVYVRARIGLEAGVTATSRGPIDQNTAAWFPTGEIEDYGMAVANAVLRVHARTLGGVASTANLSLSNTLDSSKDSKLWPSETTDKPATSASGAFTASRNRHALVSRTAPTTLTTVGMGASDATAMNGWKLSSQDTWCEDSSTGTKLNATVNTTANTVTVPGTSAAPAPQEINCYVTYVPVATAAASTVTAEPSANADSPIATPAGTSAVTVAALAQVNGGTNPPTAAAEGVQVNLALTPIQNSGATADGARIEYSEDQGNTWKSAGQSHTCVTNSAGACSNPVRIAASTPGGYNLKAQMGSAYLKNAKTGATTDTSPVQIYFKAGAAADLKSSMAITNTGGQQANHNSAASAAWGKQTITLTLAGESGAPFADAAKDGVLTVSPADGAEGLYYSDGGQFACQAADATGGCPDGIYELRVYSSKAGAKQIKVTYNPPGGSSFLVKEEGTRAEFVTAVFTTPPADAGSSAFTFAGQGETVPENDLGDPTDEPDGVGVPHQVGYSFHPAIRVWDAGRDNPVGEVPARFSVDQSCSAVFLGNAGSDPRVFQVDTAPHGWAQAVLRSETAESCRVTGEIEVAGKWTEVPGGDGNPWTKTAIWEDGEVDLDSSSFTVSTEEVEANGQDSGTVTATLADQNGLPITTGADLLAGFGPENEGVAVGKFAADPQGGGVYHAAFTGTQSGDKDIVVQANGETLTLAAGGNRTAHLVAGAPAAENSWLVQPAAKAPADGSSTVAVRARAFDAQGNPAAKGTVVFHLPGGVTAGAISGPADVQVPVAAGWAAVDLSATVKGTYEVTASAGDPAADIKAVKTPAGELIDEEGKVWAEFTAGDPSPDASVLTIPTTGAQGTDTMEVGGAKHRAEVAVKDAKGNALAAGDASVVFGYRYTDAAGKVQDGTSQPVAIGDGGVAAWEFSSEAAAVWSVTAQIAEAQGFVKGSPQQAGFHAAALDTVKTLASFQVDESANAADGVDYAWAKMRAQDSFGNPIKDADLGFSLNYADDENGPLFGDAETGDKETSLESGPDGWAEVNAYSLWPGDFQAQGSYQGATSQERTIKFSNAAASYTESSFKVEAKAGNKDLPQARADGEDAYTVTVTLRDSAGKPLNAAGATVVFTPQAIPGAEAQQFQVTSGGAGVGLAVQDLKTLKAGTWEVQVRVGQDAIGFEDTPGATSAKVEFLAGPAVAGSSKLNSPIESSKANGQERQVVTAQVADAAGNPVGGAAVDFAVPQGVKALTEAGTWASGPATVVIPTSGDSASKGVASLALTSTVVGSYEVTAQVGGADIETDSPAWARFVNADLSLGKSEFSIPTMPAAMVAGVGFHTPKVTLRDESGNVYTPPASVTFYYRLDGQLGWSEGPTVATSAGVALWDTFTQTKAGTYEVRAVIPQGQIQDADTVRKAVFKAGPADLQKSTLTVTTGAVAPNDTDVHEATLTLRDSYGNAVPDTAVDFALAGGDAAHFATSGCEDRTCPRVTSQAGQAMVAVASPEALTTTVSGLLDSALVGAKDLLFQAGAPVAGESSWSITPGGGALVADGATAYEAVVTLRDEHGAPVDGGAVDFDVPGAVTVTPAAPWAAGPDGKVTVKLTSETAGTYTVNALIGSAKIPEEDKKIAFVAGDVSLDAARTFLTPPPSGATADGQSPLVVTATVRDAKGNPVPSAQVRFAVPAGTVAQGATEGQVNANGQATLTLVSEKAGEYGVTAQVRQAAGEWKDIKGGSPAKAVFTAGAVSGAKSKIYATEAGPKTADGADSYTVNVELKDKYSNPVKTAGLPVLVEFRLVDGTGTPVPGVPAELRPIQTDAAGVASTEFATVKAGTWRATAAVGGAQVEDGSPVDLVFGPGEARAAASQLAVTDNSVLANGQAEHGATVTVKDAYGNPVPDTLVVFAVEEGAPGVAGPTLNPEDGTAKSGPDGVARVSITSREPGSFLVSAQIEGDTVAKSPQPVSFDSGPADPNSSNYGLSPDTSKGLSVAVTASGNPEQDFYTLTVTVRSNAGILVPNAKVRLDGLDSSKVSAVEQGGFLGATGSAKSSNYGTYTWHLYSDRAGEPQGSVQVATEAGAWAYIAPEPFTLRFAAGTASASNSWLIAPAAPARANGEAKVRVGAHVRDANGNDARTGAVQFTVPAGLTAHVGGTATAGGEDVTVSAPVSFGYAWVEYSSTSAASATVGATVEDGAIELVKDTAEAATVNDKGQVTVQFIAGDASAGASILTIPTAAETKIANGADAHRAEVAAKDAQGNPAPGTLVMFRYGVDDAHLTERAVPAGPGGVAYVEFTSRTATSYVVHAEVAGDAVVNSPETAAFAPGPFDVDRTLASFEVQDATALATGKQELWAKMRAQDAQGNPVKDQTLGFKLTASGDGAVFTPLADGLKEASGVSGADGWVEVHVVSEFEGDFPVVGTVGVEESAPQDARFVNDAADWKTSWFQVQAAANNKTDPATADGKDSYVVRVNLRNEAGDPVNGLPAEIRIVGGEDGERRFTVTTSRIGGQSGTAEYAFKSTEAGKFTLYVEVGGDQLSQPAAGGKDKSAVVQFKAGAASDAKSYLVGPKTGQAKADGNEQQVVEAYVRDAQGNPVTGGTVGFDVPSGVTAVDLASGGPVDGPAAVPVAPDANGVAAIAMVSLVKGQYEVTAKVGAMEIRRGSPAKLNFANTDVSAARSAFTIPTAGDVKTVRREFHRLRVELFDASGNAYTDVSQTVTFRWRPDGATAWAGTRDVPSSSAGVAEWPSWTVTRAGVWEVEAWIATGQVGTALKAAFKADVALETASQFESSSGAVVANDGQSAHFAQVTVLDAVSEGNPVSGQDVVFRVDGQAKISGAAGAGQEKTVASSDLGQARVEVVDAAQGGGETVAVEAFVNGVKVGSAPLDFRPGAVDPGKSALRVRPTTALSGAHPGVTADGADSYTATVTVVDGAGSVLVGQTVVFEASPGLTALESGPFRTNALGQVSATLVSRTAGSHSLRALLGTDAASPGLVELVFQSGPMASGTSYLEAPAASAVADGSDPLTVAAYVLDANSNPLAGADVRFALPQGVDVLGEAPGLDSFDAKTDKNGRAAVVLVSTRADSYGVTAQAKPAGTAAWAPVSKNSPAAAVFVAGSIDPVYSQISRTPDGPLTVGKAPEGYEVRVDLLDRYGNPVKQANVPVEFRFFLGEPQGATQDPEAYCRQAPDSATRFASGLTDADGVAKVRFLSNVAGPWYGCAFYAGDRIVGGSPAPLGFTAGSVDAAASALQVSQNPVPADGKAAHYAKVYVRDAFGNPLGGREVQISIEEGAAGVAGPNVKGSSGSSAVVSTCDPAAAAAAPAYCTAQGVFQAGLAYVEFTSEEPGVFAVAAKVGGLPVAGSGQTVSFTAGTPDSGRSSWRIAPDTADPVDGDSVSVPATGLPEDSYALTVEVRSGSNLLAPGVQVRIDGLSSLVGVEGGSLDAVTGTPESGSMGRHTWKLNSRAPGTYRGQVQVWNGASWVNVGGQFKVRFAAGAPVAGNSWLVEPAGSVSVAGPAPALLEARVADAQGNPVDQGAVVFQLPAGVWPEGRPQDAGSAVEVGVAGGSAVVRLAAEKAGRYGVGASIKGADPAAILTVKSSGGVILSDEGLAYVEFTAGAVSGRDSSLTIPTANAPLPVGGGYHRAEVLVTDAHGNPVSGPEVEFSWAVGTADGPSGQVWTKVETPVEANAQGVAAYEFAAPGNAAGWVWIKASVAGAAGAEAVGGPQTAPAAAQTVAGAQFTAAAAATATLTTYDGAVPNDMAGRAWARVVVADQYGNGVGGVPVAFTLPAQTAAPVFLEDGNPTGAATTVVTCGDEPADPPAACLVGGVYTPGLALAQAVSAHEGVFPVGAVAGSGPDGIVLAPSNVVFSSGAASAEASSFKLERTDATATHVVADAAQSYTLTVTAANGVTGAVAGACVAPDLPAGVTVAAPKSGAPCAAGEYAADSSGVAALRIVSRVAGVAGVGVQLGGSPVATEAGGSVYAVDALFVGGPPSGPHSELTSPGAPARADDPEGLTVLATVRDAFGNLAACWDGAVAAPCLVDFWVPQGTWAGEGAAPVTGPAWVREVPAPAVDYGASRLRRAAAAPGVAQLVYFGGEGTHQVGAQVASQAFGLADGADWAPAQAKATLVFTDSTAPGGPVVNPSDGGSVTGEVGPGDLEDAKNGDLTVVVKDEEGNVIVTCPVRPDGTFHCPVSPKLPDGSKVTVEVTDKAGNTSDPVDVVTDGVAPSRPTVEPSDGGTIGGQGSKAGDTITVKDADGNTLCTAVVGEDLNWSCDLSPTAKEGDMLAIVEEDALHNTVERPWRVGVPRLTVAKPTVCGGQPQAVVGENFQPAEQVTLTAAGAEDTAPGAVGEDGRVRFEWTVASEAQGKQAVRLTGPESGSVSGEFDARCPETPAPAVTPTAAPEQPPAAGNLPFTGARGAAALAGTALALLTLGCWMFLAARRRRAEREVKATR